MKKLLNSIIAIFILTGLSLASVMSAAFAETEVAMTNNIKRLTLSTALTIA